MPEQSPIRCHGTRSRRSTDTKTYPCKNENSKETEKSPRTFLEPSLCMPWQTESNLQAWNSDPNALGSRTWPMVWIELTVALRNDDTNTEEQYVQRTAEQVQQLVTTERIWIKTNHQRTTFSVRRQWRQILKQATVSYVKFSKELTKYNVSVATHTLKLDFKYVHAEENWTCRKKCSPASDKNVRNSVPMPKYEEPGMVLSFG